MVSIIHNPSGLTLYSKEFKKIEENKNDHLESDLIGSFITALKLFSHEFGQDEIKHIEMSTLRFLIYEKNKIMIFFLLDNTDDILKYKVKLKLCLNAFFKMFSKQIYSNYHEVNIFQKYNPVLHEILEVPPSNEKIFRFNRCKI
ncbi:MAG: hypothetical protein ACTSRI_18440 [Promethearchaeota archaeon]